MYLINSHRKHHKPRLRLRAAACCCHLCDNSMEHAHSYTYSHKHPPYIQFAYSPNATISIVSHADPILRQQSGCLLPLYYAPNRHATNQHNAHTASLAIFPVAVANQRPSANTRLPPSRRLLFHLCRPFGCSRPDCRTVAQSLPRTVGVVVTTEHPHSISISRTVAFAQRQSSRPMA